jgi:hypothetical protein
VQQYRIAAEKSNVDAVSRIEGSSAVAAGASSGRVGVQPDDAGSILAAGRLMSGLRGAGLAVDYVAPDTTREPDVLAAEHAVAHEAGTVRLIVGDTETAHKVETYIPTIATLARKGYRRLTIVVVDRDGRDIHEYDTERDG